MRKRIAAATAGAILCALALSACTGGHHGATGGNDVGGTTPTTAPAAGGGAQQAGANGVPSGTPTGVSAVDSELKSVDQQLGAAGTDLSHATAQPSDGD